MSLINDGVLNRANKATVMRLVRSEILKLSFLNDLERNKLTLWADSYYKHTVAAARRETDLDKRASNIYAVLRKDNLIAEKVKNSVVDNIMYREKHKDLVKILRDDENKFFYCTAHENCAEGHQAYQGQFYYRKSGTYSGEEATYIRDTNMLSVEEVVMGPIWLTTRKNCRHRLIPVSFDYVKNGEIKGERKFHNIDYDEENYRLYSDRLKMLRVMKKNCVNGGVKVPAQLDVDLKRTYKLVRAWKQKMKKG